MENAKCVLAALVRRGCKLYAVTSNYYDFAEIGLKSQQLLPYFTTLYSCLSMGYADKEQAFFRKFSNKSAWMLIRLFMLRIVLQISKKLENLVWQGFI